MTRLPFSSPTPGPTRLFLYAEAVVLLLLSVSLLSSYIERYPPLSQAGGDLYQIAETRQAADGSVSAEDGSSAPSAGNGEDGQGGTEGGSAADEKKTFIKWVDFTVTCEAMTKALDLDVDTYQSDPHLNWIELLAYLGAKYGGDFSRYKATDMDKLAQTLKEGGTMEELTKEMKYYDYYLEAYTAVLGGMVGPFQVESPADQAPVQTDNVSEGQSSAQADGDTGQTPAPSSPPGGAGTVWTTTYGLRAFSPIAKGFPYTEFDDFGTARSYGYKRQHLGHDMMGQVGTPIIAVESGIVEALGWNQYGGWRIGIRSFDQKRYYYYAHLRKNYPYQSNLKEGSVVQAGDVIGYMGRTGYSKTENTNNIDESHLHFGLQLIFDESQKDGNNEIWISCYELARFLHQHQSQTEKVPDTKEWRRIYGTKDL